jgi:glycosyltransferase involved in cell wall biosynthesis
MRITLVTQDFSSNCFGRTYLLAQMLSPEFEIEFAGFRRGRTWSVCGDHGFREISQPFADGADYDAKVFAIATDITGDLIIACKAWPVVFDIVRAALRRRQVPVILDIDDWEGAWWSHAPLARKARFFVRSLFSPEGYLRQLMAEFRARRGIWPRIVSNSFLQNRFGGVIIPHACDTDAINPENCQSRAESRKKLRLPQDAFVVGFVGTPKYHKGIEDLIAGIGLVDNPRVCLFIAGVGVDDDYARLAADKLGNRFYRIPVFDKKLLGDMLMATDTVCLPQKDLPACRGQMPAKVYDAMAMGIPPIVSSMSDLPETVRDCGLVIPPDNPKAIAAAVLKLTEDRGLLEKLGKNAREKCVRLYSQKIVGEKLRRMVRDMF